MSDKWAVVALYGTPEGTYRQTYIDFLDDEETAMRVMNEWCDNYGDEMPHEGWWLDDTFIDIFYGDPVVDHHDDYFACESCEQDFPISFMVRERFEDTTFLVCTGCAVTKESV